MRVLRDVSRSLAVRCPEVAAQWHPTRNGVLTAEMVSHGSRARVWWLGECGHEWDAEVIDRSRGTGCPFCSSTARRVLVGFNDLVTTHPAIAALWHPTRNGALTAQDVLGGSEQKAWWLGECGHEWEAKVKTLVVRGRLCPFCAVKARRVLVGFNDLATTHPDLAGQWHPTRNGDLRPEAVTERSAQQVWWVGECGHEWESKAYVRARGRGCPFCAPRQRRALAGETDLATTQPEVAALWHPTRNGDLTPQDVLAGSTKTVWWKCPAGHEASRQVLHQVGHGRCVVCSPAERPPVAGRRRWGTLAADAPGTAAHWHPTRNGDLTADSVSFGSSRKVWWLCECGHEWEATVNSRTGKGTGCPACALERNSTRWLQVEPEKSLARRAPVVAAQWHPTRNGDLSPERVTRFSNKRVWWLCRGCGFEWSSQVRSRTDASACPGCREHPAGEPGTGSTS